MERISVVPTQLEFAGFIGGGYHNCQNLMSAKEELDGGPVILKKPPNMKDIGKSAGGGDTFDSGIDEESIVGRISHLKLTNDEAEDNNNNKCVRQAETVDDKDGHPKKEKSATIIESKAGEPAIDGKKAENADVSENEENSKTSKPESPKGSQSPQSPGRLSPAEFFQTSRLRCSALANKLNTTQTFGGAVELSHETSSAVDEITKGVESVILDEKKEKSDEEKKDDQGDDKSAKSEETQEERELIDRSPVPGYTANRHAHHPYQQPQQARYPNCQASPSRGYYQMKVEDPASYSPAYYMEQQRYKAGAQPGFCPARQPQPQPQAVPSPTYLEYGSYNNAMWSPPNGYYQQQQSIQEPCMSSQYNQGVGQEQPIDISPPTSVINSLADMCQMMSNKSPMAVLSPFSLSPQQPTDTAKVDGVIEEKSTPDADSGPKPVAATREIQMEELPDELCDFILTYSRQYTAKNELALSGDKSSCGSVVATDNSGEVRSTPCTPETVSSGYETAFTDGRSSASVHDGSSVSDLMFSPAFYTNSPNAYSPQQDRKEQKSPPNQDADKEHPLSSARNRLREQIDQKDLDSALAWAMRCCQSRPEALFFRDKDGDSLLHIVIWHKDLAKIYVLTEIILKSTQDGQPSAPKLFDLPNKQNETPLFLAVEKGLKDVVAYLLECGADTSVCPNYGDSDPPLHYAATRGMADIVQILCASGRGGVNILNGAGMTPLLCAVKNHGNLDAESQCMVDNTMVIKTLLKTGADASIQDASSGKNVLHLCVERMDPAMIQLFGDHLERSKMARLVNSCDYNGCTPLSLVSAPSLAGTGGPDDEKLRQKMSKLLLEYSVGQNLSADDFGDLSYLLSDQVPADGVQFTVLDTYLSSQAY